MLHKRNKFFYFIFKVNKYYFLNIKKNAPVPFFFTLGCFLLGKSGKNQKRLTYSRYTTVMLTFLYRDRSVLDRP